MSIIYFFISSFEPCLCSFFHFALLCLRRNKAVSEGVRKPAANVTRIRENGVVGSQRSGGIRWMLPFGGKRSRAGNTVHLKPSHMAHRPAVHAQA